MGLLDEQNNADYYQGSDLGNYQFTSLDSVISQFEIAYVGEGKIIPKIKRADIAFFAQRALQELSFDTFKSIKSQEITLAPSLQMILPHDYVNYSSLTYSDSSGIEHIIYPTSKTSNPFSVVQDVDGNYDFSGNDTSIAGLNNLDFSTSFNSNKDWSASTARNLQQNTGTGQNLVYVNPNSLPTQDIFNSVAGVLTAKIHKERYNANGVDTIFGRHYSCWQEVDVTGIDEISLSGFATAPADATGFNGATVRLGISATKGDQKSNPHVTFGTPSQNSQTFGTGSNNPNASGKGPNFIPYNNTVAFVEWQGGTTLDSAVKSLPSINVSSYDKVFVLITMFADVNDNLPDNTSLQLTLDDISVIATGDFTNLQSNNESKTWGNYKSSGTAESNNDDYIDDTYWHMNGNRYGLDPQHAQSNGSFYIDSLKGLIHFSSNISGKTVILKYISDSLGTDAEMQVHKFAEEAMYKCIAYAILSTTVYGQQLVPRFKKEKFAEVRKAKLRLSSLKLEELTQILRGKSKWIKH